MTRTGAFHYSELAAVRRCPQIEMERFGAKVARVGECWLWMGAQTHNGYGRFMKGYAHRWAYETFIGPIPEGLDLDHLCRVRHCVNPYHLEPVTRSENLKRSPLVGRWMSVRTHCKHGHEFTEENTYWIKGGAGRPGRNKRRCATCQREQQRKARA